MALASGWAVFDRDDRFDPQGRAYGSAPSYERLRREYAWMDRVTPCPVPSSLPVRGEDEED